MDNKQFLEDKATTNAAAEEILSDEELDSVAGGGGTGSGDRATINMEFNIVDQLKNTTSYAGSTGPG